MSELINKNDNSATIRWKLLTSVSVLALAAYVSSAGMARAEDTDHPLIWIELGGQAAWTEDGQEAFLSPFDPSLPRPFEVVSPATVEEPARTTWNEDAKISFEPAGSDWKLSAAIMYGRSNRNQFLSQQTRQLDQTHYGAYVAFQDVTSHSKESHTILDFQAGKDVGLGAGINSSINLGVRYVQFGIARNAFIESQPTNLNSFHPHHKINARLAAVEKFSGVGPSISWDASAAVAGNTNDGELGLDWSVNGAVLFGRQRVRGHHQTTNAYYTSTYARSYYKHSAPLHRNKRITVPNLGGYAAVSWNTSNAKISIGYRADMFFGSMDGGIDTAKKENRGFFGPFASISVGIGD